jgi:4-alpha-glucanotransferase
LHVGLVTESDNEKRSSGLLLHITSLPGHFGIGDLGPEAAAFVKRLADAGQRQWQVLPVGPTGYGNSPYSALSTFAGNVLLISPQLLMEQGLAGKEDLETVATRNDGQIDFGHVFTQKLEFLRGVAERFGSESSSEQRGRLAEFRDLTGPEWLDDYSSYVALKDAHGGRAWSEWDPELAQREPAALDRARRELSEEIESVRILQFLFFEQWNALREATRENGIEIVGDLPLYVAHDSADVWANRDLFLLDADGMPTVVAGVPPDYFSDTGQRWGNPIFDWQKMAANRFAWWTRRMKQAVSLFDRVRIDHFRGIAGYWEIPASEPTAVKGKWRTGPGRALFEAIRDELGQIPIIAEDLGVITEDVVALREQFDLPGMRVAQFGFDKAPDSSIHHPDSYPENVWAYTGTHDNDTTLGWFWKGNPEHRVKSLEDGRKILYEAVDGHIPWGLVEMVSDSNARQAMFPVQDVLELGSEARMNTPGTTEGNWQWRLQPGQLTDEALFRLRELTKRSDRLGSGS